MARGIPSAMQTAAVADVVRPVLLAKLEFASGTIRVSTADRTLVTPGGETYIGVGNFGGVDGVDEDIQLGANGVTLLLSGVDPNLISLALQENYQGRAATISVGLLTSAWAFVAEPTIVFSGLMDTMSVVSGTEGRISLSCENRLAAWDRARNLRFNNQTQQIRYPGDRGLEFVEQAADREIFWGRAPGREAKGAANT